MTATSDNYTKATGDGWVEFFVDDGRPVVRAEVGRDEGRALLDTIAAAPALLAAAKNMVLAFDHGDADSEQDALRQIKEAIAEAEPVRPDQHYGSDEAMETVLEIVRGWDDRELCRFLAECWPGKIVKVGDDMIRHDEDTGQDEILA